jgi:hypothetical protein
VIDFLENASDYNRGMRRLDEKGLEIVKRLRQWAGDLSKLPEIKENVRLQVITHVSSDFDDETCLILRS